MKKNMNKIFAVGCMSAMLMSMCACGANNDTTETTTTEVVTEQEVSSETTETVTGDEKVEGDVSVEHSLNNIEYIMDQLTVDTKNTVLSDTSLNMALGLASLGSAGETRDVFSNYFGNDVDVMNNYHSNLIKSYANDDTLSFANSVWADDKFILKDDYIKLVEDYYDGTSQSLDFSDDKSVDVINDWCKEKTNGLIPSIVSSDSLAQSDAILTNALYFNGKWVEPFNESQVIDDQNFTTFDGTTQKVTMMNGTSDIYYENDYATAFGKMYEGEGIEFIGILPKQEGTYSLQELDLDSLLDGCSSCDVIFGMPKFKVEDSNSLTDVLKTLGFEDIFNGNCDFSGMIDESIRFTDVIQKTYVDVNEEGTEAAAVTAVEIAKCALPSEEGPKEVILNRPFTFMIYDTVNDECLFIGNMNTLE